MELVCDGASPLQPGPAPYPLGKPAPVLTALNSSCFVGYGVSQLADAGAFPAGRAVLLGRIAPECSRTVFVRPITPSTPPAIVAGRRTAVELEKYSTPREPR